MAALFLAFLGLALTGCGSLPLLQDRAERASTVARQHGWSPQIFDTGQFRLRGYHPPYSRNASDLAIYIEGDGVAWISPTVMSSDPTPDEPTTLRMAVRDPTPNRLYLARPCQYGTSEELARCSPSYWTSHRYAAEVVDALDAAVDEAVRDSGAKRITLIGYSGGGTLAVLIASRRQDVAQVVTVAGNLDHEVWTRAHGDTPLYGSLNAADAAESIGHIPQIHFIGADDDVVSPAVSASYRQRVHDPSRISIIRVADAGHICCWVAKWPGLLRKYVYR